MKRAAIYDPYLDSLGGGERYSLTLATVLEDLGFKVDLVWSGREMLKEASERFGQELGGINVRPDFFKRSPLFTKWRTTSEYDFIFFVSDGSVPFLLGKVNWLHFQVPFKNVGGLSLSNKVKFASIKRVVVNSQFTKGVIDKEYGVSGEVLYPPVATDAIKVLKKERVILSVGRFSKLLQSKRHDFLVRAFKELVDEGLNGWTLNLVGGLGGMNEREMGQLRDEAKGYPIKFIFEPNFSELADLYGRSSIFWSASGYGEDEVAHPERVEHFGITLVEAMAAGCIVLPVNKGGFKEILGQEFESLAWDTPGQLMAKTREVAVDSSSSIRKVGDRLRKRALAFSCGKFKMGVETRISYDFKE